MDWGCPGHPVSPPAAGTPGTPLPALAPWNRLKLQNQKSLLQHEGHRRDSRLGSRRGGIRCKYHLGEILPGKSHGFCHYQRTSVRVLSLNPEAGAGPGGQEQWGGGVVGGLQARESSADQAPGRAQTLLSHQGSASFFIFF